MTGRALFRAGLLAVAVNGLTAVAAAAEPVAPKADTWVIPKEPPAAPAPVVETAPPSRSLFRYGAIAVILGGVVAVAYQSRKRATAKGLPESGRLVLLDSLRLGPQAQLVVVSVAGRTMLLSVTGAHVRRVAPLDDWNVRRAASPAPHERAARDDDEANDDDREAQAAYAPPAAASFGHMLRRFVTNLDGRVPADPAIQIAEETVDRVELRPRPAPRAPRADAPAAREPVARELAAPAARAARKARNEDAPPSPQRRVANGAPAAENQVAGLMARRSARGA